jgi:hypothetical protein
MHAIRPVLVALAMTTACSKPPPCVTVSNTARRDVHLVADGEIVLRPGTTADVCRQFSIIGAGEVDVHPRTGETDIYVRNTP